MFDNIIKTFKEFIKKLSDFNGIVIYRKRENYDWIDTTQYIKKEPNFVYLKEGTFVEAKPGFVYVKNEDILLSKPGHSLVPDYFLSTRHKQIDIRTLPEFGGIARQVIEQGRVLLGYDRLYIIYQSIQAIKRLVKEGHAINLAEVGVFKGGTTRFIALCADVMNMTIRLHGFDTFEGHSDVDIKPGIDREKVHTPGLFNETDFDTVSDYLKDMSNIILYKGRFQDTSPAVKDEKFYFVHSDVDLYEPTRYILAFMAPRLVNKGVIVVDDYGNSNCPGVIQAVEEFLEQNKNFIRIALLTGQCMLIKD